MAAFLRVCLCMCVMKMFCCISLSMTEVMERRLNFNFAVTLFFCHYYGGPDLFICVLVVFDLRFSE